MLAYGFERPVVLWSSKLRRIDMTKLIVLAVSLVGITAAIAGNKPPGPPDPNRPPKNPALYEKCHELARERGWGSGANSGKAKGAIKPGHFIGNCMRGLQT